MNKEHHYKLLLEWTGNLGTGTSDYRAYTRNHTVSSEGKPQLLASSDPAFRGDKSRYNPEEMLVAALSSCHMLSYLHVCVMNGVVVLEYTDNATGTMKENSDGSGQFVEVTLHPTVKVKDPSMIEKANGLHHKASELCFIARSVNFPVHHVPIAIN
ncbi:MAG TPA: OsmC family protein [Cyclobacteriaceae bacterium]|jgi:organic hydroperoxide reductase OsmC/OhrA|nr:OsmC family protein [Cyclobacteriaceae bacterium]